ncbi:MAG: acyltransferase [Polyangiaceae bacterium]|nr:acyltransferase [Polyangiaceae bacterium]
MACTLARRERSGVESRLRGAASFAWRHGTGLRVGRGVEVIAPEHVVFGDHVTLFGHTIINAFGASGSVVIGDDTHIDHYGVLYGQGGLSIGRQCAIAARVTIYSQTNRFDAARDLPVIEQPVKYDPVRIGDDVWIGAGAVILPGSRISDHAVIAAGAVVTGASVAPWAIVAGVPARKIGDRRAQEGRAVGEK